MLATLYCLVSWLQTIKVTHDWGNNLITIEGNCIIHIIIIIKHLDSNTNDLKSFSTMILLVLLMKRKMSV
jgi:hypothetical protein